MNLRKTMLGSDKPIRIIAKQRIGMNQVKQVRLALPFSAGCLTTLCVAITVMVLETSVVGSVPTSRQTVPVAQHLQEAETAFLAGNYKTAQTLYSEVIEAGWQNAPLLGNFAMAAYANKQPGYSLAALLRASQLATSDENIRRNLEQLLTQSRGDDSSPTSGTSQSERLSNNETEFDRKALTNMPSLLGRQISKLASQPSPWQWLAIVSLASALSLFVVLKQSRRTKRMPGKRIHTERTYTEQTYTEQTSSGFGLLVCAVMVPLLLAGLAQLGLSEKNVLRGSTVSSKTPLLSAPSAYASTVAQLPNAKPILSEKLYQGTDGKKYRRVRVLDQGLAATDIWGWIQDESAVFY